MNLTPIADVTVIIPTFNRAHLLPETLSSIFAQTLQPREIIVVDDGSTDNTSEVVKEYEDKITFIFQKNQGVSAARNQGIRIASTKYIAFNDSDDHWLPEKLEIQVAAMEKNSSFIAHVCNVCWFKKDGKLTNQVFRRDEIDDAYELEGELALPLEWVLNDSVAVIQTMMIRTSIVKRSGLFDETLSIWEDTDFAARVALCGSWGYSKLALVRVRAVDEGSDRLSIARNDLTSSLEVKSGVLNALNLRVNNEKECLIIKTTLAMTTYALAGAKVRMGAVTEGCRYYIKAFKLGIRLKSAIMMIYTFISRGKLPPFATKSNKLELDK